MDLSLNCTRTCHARLGRFLKRKVLNQWIFCMHRLADNRKGREATYDASGAETWVTTHESCTRAKVNVAIAGIVTAKIKRFGRRGATESDGPVNAPDTPNGASETPSEAVARAAVSGRSARSARAVTTPGVVDSKRVSDQGPDTSRMFSAIRRRDDNSVSTLGVDTRSISKSRKFSAVGRQSDNSLQHTAPPKGVEVTTKHRLPESIRQVGRTVANVQH
ncbi:hypothetical protein PHMEG_00015619 [Phytophthora megakarya]|uniref:Uncharacterized protein n=1 Tax=Phytophthora megakarya TaxID=4795 RepID=A0A225W3D2_9STRA|nr:hypothetical protein PHMEG_00015619 [Phytophthora megakarya]